MLLLFDINRLSWTYLVKAIRKEFLRECLQGFLGRDIAPPTGKPGIRIHTFAHGLSLAKGSIPSPRD
jgi:hypothetical protein